MLIAIAFENCIIAGKFKNRLHVDRMCYNIKQIILDNINHNFHVFVVSNNIPK